MSSFKDILNQYDWEQVKHDIYSKTTHDVEIALSNKKRNLEDFKALISPAAQPFLETMAQLSHSITQKRFGNTIQMYIPLYLSNECTNICTYCGFSLDVPIQRITLNKEQIIKEIEIIKGKGFNHILLVTGEANKTVGIDYFKEVLQLIRPYFSHISMEIQPLEQKEYEELHSLGLNTVMIYQETYHQEKYAEHHPKGKKSNFLYRLTTPDRLGKAGIYKIGIGALLGLEDWRADSFFVALHLSYLEKTYWETKYSISFPRLRPCAGKTNFHSVMNDKELLQLICAYRIFNEEVELSLSTRESQKFRNNVLPLGITTISAGSKTQPGGYFNGKDALEQFEVNDDRTPKEIEKQIKSIGYEVVWKDWDVIME